MSVSSREARAPVDSRKVRNFTTETRRRKWLGPAHSELSVEHARLHVISNVRIGVVDSNPELLGASKAN